jgi:simple sugar transport system ATP-binding protein
LEDVLSDIAVELRHIVKKFPGVVANRDVSLQARRGEVHALVGENGAGKSTVMKVLYGMQRPDGGEILVNGEHVLFKSPAEAIEAGIGMVHQHFMLADNFTVLENVILGSEPTKGGRIDVAAARERILSMAAAYGLDIDPDAMVETLGVGERQRVEILKVLYRGARILIFDEPTAVLVPQEVDELFDALRGLRAEGLTVIFISHKLDEVLRVADNVTVIRQGATVAEVAAHDVTSRQLAELMVGSDLPVAPPRATTRGERVVLDVQHLTVPSAGARDLLHDITFNIHAGEVVGIAGVEGNGQSELVQALIGLIPSSGTVVFNGTDVSLEGVAHRRDAGMGLIPEDRQREALLMSAPLWENRILGHQRTAPLVRRGILNRKAAHDDSARIMQEYDVRAPGVETAAYALSGGNQQKFIVGREMERQPSLLLASHPTRGVDVGAQAAIWEELRKARDNGMAILLVSADLEELIGMSDVLKVMLRGTITATLDPSTTTPERLGSAMTGAAA